MRWLDGTLQDNIVGEQVLEAPPPHSDVVESGRGSDAPERTQAQVRHGVARQHKGGCQ